MSYFKIRTSLPSLGSKLYNNKSAGGLSTCITGSPTKAGLNVLSNCVGWSCSRFNEIYNEITGNTSMKYWYLNCNAENFIERAKAYGLQVVDHPVYGGIMVWKKGATLSGSDGAGHVEVVEDIYSESSIFTSASNYGGTTFYNAKRSNSNGRWGLSTGYKFRGCIVNPAIGDKGYEPKEDKPEETTGELKYKLGDVVVINGRLYGDSYGNNPGATVSNRVTTITRINKGAPYPYNTVGDLGWMSESSISKTTSSQRTYKVVKGDTVSGICAKFYGKSTKTEWDKIKNANNLNSNYLIITGQTLIIP